MKAAVVDDAHNLQIVETPDPAVGSDDLVLQVTACGICGSDLKAVHSLPGGTIMGHEFCGEVAAVGRNLAGEWREGQRATALPVIGCGRCAACLTGDVARCDTVDLIGVGGSAGAFAQYVRVSGREAFHVPDLPADDAAALVEPLAVGLHAVNIARLEPGARVAVIGAGPVGLAVVSWARLLGAGEIVVSDLASPRREAAGAFGATDAIDPTSQLLPGTFDVVFECVGIPGMIDVCVAAARTHGTVVVTGVCMEPDPFMPLVALLKELTMRFVAFYHRREFAHALDALARGQIDPAPFITDRVTLDGIGDAFAALSANSGQRKVLVRP
ncbi:zinc-binding dehydrogenase [Nocardia miyunensis]|uniref:zinc-binding dehydrogenase n=1 Tax=Nocardia miyunensis TaxID=282684 RepID=UPI00082EC368|nr:alcohol dehydrogenase catalytic domain-containing protein [Nocardia miyunensis]